MRNNIVSCHNEFIQLMNAVGKPTMSAIAENNTFIWSKNTSTSKQAAFNVYAPSPASLTLRNNIIVNLQNSPAPVDFDWTGYQYHTYTFENNVVSDNSFAGTTGVVSNASPASLFQHLSSTAYDLDYKVQNASGSPAVGAGTNGVTCGAYGGSDPYSPSGHNLIPNIYEIQIPNVGSNRTIGVQIKTRANK